ncbi:hypothetical protein [Stutzerimonas stutzeri]|uniref:Uncharacterized protein n=1 Tax=Stutzerimonas stutzeri TaxID=316 RepID=A0A6I6LP40_STUST|nr:hypothetical protein [Stutzerimonas stutzeri]QGZ31003.1 hypothetical protein GQA94_13375 [Stutzerimonas stutzeri]
MLDSATRVFIDGGSVQGGFAMQKSNEANVNIIQDDDANRSIDGARGESRAGCGRIVVRLHREV